LTVTNDQLATKNAENELLLKEIHHRVKNNLQTISSLLNLQSASIKDPNALEAVQESQSRVRSMALIHQKLYQGENLAAVNMKEYFEAMGQSMLHSFGETGKRITLEVPMNDLELDVDTAIPLGLIANELVTNSLKYAFPDGQKGQIEISLTAEPNQQFCLRIADNGVGQTESPVVQGTGFGTRLVKLLAIQLNGNVETNTAKGLATLVRFSPIPKAA
jgi:two-component sensor histidine kinase